VLWGVVDTLVGSAEAIVGRKKINKKLRFEKNQNAAGCSRNGNSTSVLKKTYESRQNLNSKESRTHL